MVAFISYRRDDTLQMAASVFRSLQRHYQQQDIFFDLPRQSPGANLRDKLTREVMESDVVIAIVGRHWAERLADEEDAVRLELETALGARKKIFVILADGAAMPSSTVLPESVRGIRQVEGTALRPLEFDDDVDAIVALIEAERERIREEIRLENLLEKALSRNDYAAAEGSAKQLIRVTSNPESTSTRLNRIRAEREVRLQQAAPLAVLARQQLEDQRFDEASAYCDQALQTSPGEPNFVQLKKRIADVRENHRIETTLDRLAGLGRTDVIAFAEAVVEALKTRSLNYHQLEGVLTGHANDLRDAVIQNPENVNLRRIYLKVRSWKQKKQDEFRAKLIRRMCLVASTYGSFVVYAWSFGTIAAFVMFWGVTFLLMFAIRDDTDGGYFGTGCGIALLLFIGALISDGSARTVALWALTAVEIFLVSAYRKGSDLQWRYGPLPFLWNVSMPNSMRTALQAREDGL